MIRAGDIFPWWWITSTSDLRFDLRLPTLPNRNSEKQLLWVGFNSILCSQHSGLFNAKCKVYTPAPLVLCASTAETAPQKQPSTPSPYSFRYHTSVVQPTVVVVHPLYAPLVLVTYFSNQVQLKNFSTLVLYLLLLSMYYLGLTARDESRCNLTQTNIRGGGRRIND